MAVTRGPLVGIGAVALASLSSLAACGSATHRRAATTAGGPASSVIALVRRLSPAQLAGQRIVYAYAGLTPPRSLLARIRAGEAGGVILFGPNIVGVAQVHEAIARIERAAMASPIHLPLLLMTDQEGGLVRRLPGAPALSERRIGNSANAESLAAQAGRGAAANLTGAGLNVNLAPVLDVYRHAGDFIDEFERSYAASPTRVASLAASFIAGQQAAGVAATVKHFPGLGTASRAKNTDAVPVTLNESRAQLRAVDELPYRAAIAAGARLVMVSWATYPALDPSFPAGLSAAVIQGELRGHLGFKGVTITDGLGAGALSPFGSVADRGLEAASAGADLLLCSSTSPSANTPSEGISVGRALTGALESRVLNRASAEQAAVRVLALRAQEGG
jgi:beta-N-acetylhexosaminidase